MEPESKRGKRPGGLVVIIGLQLFLAALLALFLLGQETVRPVLRLFVRNPFFSHPAPGWIMVGMLLLAVLGLLLLKRWGWTLTMILTGIGLSFGIWSYFQGIPDYFPMLIYVVMVFYLNQSDVQRPFERKGDPESMP